MAPLEALNIKDQGSFIAFSGVYSGQDSQERYRGLNKVIVDSGYQIRGQLVSLEEEVLFNLKVPKTLEADLQYVNRLRRALETTQTENPTKVIEGEYRVVE